ncbi:MAG: metallophosphoesterase [Polyangiaceae bacterium]|nr:metallophosphoesterase [Polyangiaceae bacterium]
MVDLQRIVPVFLFVALVFFLAAGDLFAAIVHWRHKRCRPLSAETDRRGPMSLRRVRRTASVLCVGALGCMAWSFCEPYYPEVTRVVLESPKLTAPIRLVQISDLHSDPKARLEERLPGIIRELHPDLVMVTGDGINSAGGLGSFRACMRQIAGICPTFGVRGNWEVWWFSDIDVYAGTGVHKLEGRAVPVRVRDQEIWISGVAVDHEWQADAMLKRVPKHRFSVFLHHFPCEWRTAARGGSDLHLAGDTHSGQIVLPGLGPLIRITRRDGEYYAAGLHRHGSMYSYVNRGIGMEGGAVPRVRFNCRPEIALFELGPPAGAAERSVSKTR